jgi:prepilin-type N-terminal cleavage/methylation domain-containing protein
MNAHRQTRQIRIGPSARRNRCRLKPSTLKLEPDFNSAFRSPRVGPLSAFTLVELLVVIAVIAILAAILLSVLASAKRKAEQVNCVNNIRQLTLASYIYATDTGSHATYNDPATLWMGTENYGNDKKVLICPSTRPQPPDENPGPGAIGLYFAITEYILD